MKGFRVLFLYPNLFQSSTLPQGIGILSALLKREGIATDVFDTTFYQISTNNPNLDKVRIHNVKAFDYGERNIKPKETSVLDDFQRKVDQFGPDLIAVSFVEDTFHIGLELLAGLRDRNIPVLAGGVFCTYAWEKVLQHEDIDWVCRGEGEGLMVDACKRLSEGKSLKDLPNICSREDGRLFSNPMRPLVELDSLPVPDFSIFEDYSFYRPMTGKIYKTIGIETMRGCPFTCAYCNSPSNNVVYKGDTGKSFLRKKGVRKIHDELTALVKQHDPEFIYMLADTFLLLTDEEFDAFVEMYSDFKLPFFMNTRPETITEYRVKKLEEINCHRVNIGLEHGNPKFRKEVVGRHITDDAIVRAFEIIGRSKISIAVNNIIGFPGETRELVFDTIALNRRIKNSIDSVGCFLFAPYHGTPLRDLAIRLGYLDADSICNVDTTKESMLRMPQLSSEQLQGLQRTFSFYVKMPKEDYPKIAIAERCDDEGNRMFEHLSRIYREKYEDRKDKADVC